METIGDTRCDAFELVKILTDTLAKVEAVDDTRGDAYVLVEPPADTLAEV